MMTTIDWCREKKEKMQKLIERERERERVSERGGKNEVREVGG